MDLFHFFAQRDDHLLQMAHFIPRRGSRRLHLFRVPRPLSLELIPQRHNGFAKLADLIRGIRNRILDRLLPAGPARFELVAHRDDRFSKLFDLALPGGNGFLDCFLAVHDFTIIEVQAVTSIRSATPAQTDARSAGRYN
jgi:hypothetical protein